MAWHASASERRADSCCMAVSKEPIKARPSSDPRTSVGLGSERFILSDVAEAHRRNLGAAFCLISHQFLDSDFGAILSD